MIRKLLIKLGLIKTIPSVASIMAPLASIMEELAEAKKAREEAIKKRGVIRLALMKADKADMDENLFTEAQLDLMDKMIAKREKRTCPISETREG